MSNHPSLEAMRLEERTRRGREVLFFFFQAEDGIRDYKVTGVQTCALPICWSCAADSAAHSGRYGGAGLYAVLPGGQSRPGRGRILECRSGCPLDGQTRPARCLKNRSAPPGCHRSQFDQTRVARSVSAPTGSRLQRLRTDTGALPSVAIAVELRCAYKPDSKREPLAMCRRAEGQNSFNSAVLSPC